MVRVSPYRVQLRDVDGFRHLSHIRLLELLEIGRVELYAQLTGATTSIAEIDLIMGELQVRYHAPAKFGDDLVIATAISGVGRSSLAFDYEAWKPAGVTVAVARTTCVCFDYAAERPRPLAGVVQRLPDDAPLPHPKELGRLPAPGSIRALADAELASMPHTGGG